MKKSESKEQINFLKKVKKELHLNSNQLARYLTSIAQYKEDRVSPGRLHFWLFGEFRMPQRIRSILEQKLTELSANDKTS